MGVAVAKPNSTTHPYLYSVPLFFHRNSIISKTKTLNPKLPQIDFTSIPTIQAMQSPCIDVCKTLSTSFFQKGLHQNPCFGIGNHTDYRTNFDFLNRHYSSYPSVSCSFSERNSHHIHNRASPARNYEVTGVRGKVRAKGKDNVWSIDNDMAEIEEKERTRGRRKRRGKRVTNSNRKGERVMVSGSMLMEVETVLQTQEPVIRPAWHTFASSVSGIWKGVGAVYSPITAEMEQIGLGNKNENLFDCYTLSHIQALPSNSGALTSQIKRKINWVTLNPYGEAKSNGSGLGNKHYGASSASKNILDRRQMDHSLPTIESFDFGGSEVMEEDVMGMEPGLIFFEDGSYSRGPVDIPIGEFDESKYYLSPTFKFEQVLSGKRLPQKTACCAYNRIRQWCSDIQILRVAVYEEEWVSPANIPDTSELELDLKPFSQRKRVQPSDLSGSWKVFEVSATPIYGEDASLVEANNAPYVYLCTENLKNRSLPDNLGYFREEEMVDMQDVAVLWLPGGVTAYVDVNRDGILCIGTGWYSDEGMNLVMEREYGLDGKLKEVRMKSEMKRRWTNPPPM